MESLSHLFENNRYWSTRMRNQDPEFFAKLIHQQAPEYLWIGCSDSRVPANEIVDLMPGELFVHRNVANVVVHTDLNCLSVVQFAVDILKVRHIMVVGHYGCGGVRVALEKRKVGLADNWLRHVQDVVEKHRGYLDAIEDPVQRRERLCELNVIEQVRNLCQTTIIEDAWQRQQDLTVHGWCYRLDDGLVTNLDFSVDSTAAMEAGYAKALERFTAQA